MQVRFNVTGKERKAFVKAISEIMGATAVYRGVPTCNYEVDYFTIDREGTLIFDDTADSREIENLFEELKNRGFEAQAAEPEETEAETDRQIGLTISIPFEETSVGNLTNLLESKGDLIKEAFEIDDIRIEMGETAVSFPWFPVKPKDPEAIKAYTHFIAAICNMAKTQVRISRTKKAVDNKKYAFRCFLLRLGFIGDEYKAERKILLKNLDGSSAFKGGAKHEISE